MKRIRKTCPNDYEHAFWKEGKYVLGLDEAGRGPLAGPLSAAGVIFPIGYENPDIYEIKSTNFEQKLKIPQSDSPIKAILKIWNLD